MKFFVPFVSLCFVAPCALTAKTPPPAAAVQKEIKNHPFVPFSGKIMAEKVRLRLQPNLEGHIIRELNRGEILAIMADENGYYGIAPPKDCKAFVYRTFILDNTVEADHVNVRLQPDLESPVVAQYNSGDRVDVLKNQTHSKWFTIDVPKGVYFWVAKEYIENIGSVDYVERFEERTGEAKQLLATAHLLSQTEFRKPFEEMDISRITNNYQRVIKEYPELENIKAEAKESLQELQKQYCDKKIAFLESKSETSLPESKSVHAKLSSKNVTAQDLSEDTFSFSSDEEISAVALPKPKDLTDKMRVWEPLEYGLFQSWNSNHPEKNLTEFYSEELLNSKQIKGIVEPFTSVLKNKPGDFFLTQNGQTVAYLYSTHVNLQEKVGKEIVLKIVERDNHGFAFPAYYVLEVAP